VTATSVPSQLLLGGYRPLSGSYDEMIDSDGRIRDHWAGLGRTLDELGFDELNDRRRQVERLLDDDGVTYTVQAEPAGHPQRWSLDPVPVLLSSAEWAAIERGAIQRAELLNLVLADLYGPRDLVRRRLLPPELVYGHLGFLRPCDQIRIPGPQQLVTCAIDLARDAEGQCWVLADRTQAPSGAGYALQNRVVISRVFPSLYRDAQVHRLAPFFRALRASLVAVAPLTATDPRVVVLTPGSLSETAFEHAFLASYLGYPLVEGSDLTMREGRLWLRTLGQLEPVDVVLRRVDTWFCDPLELRPDSHLGVPGLVEACRRGTVSVVNTLGSGVLENPALLTFLPALAKALLGQELRLPSVPTWWCGDPASRRHVLAHLDQLVIKPVARSVGHGAVVGWEIPSAKLDDLRRRIEARPQAWVGQAPLALACAPTLSNHGLDARRTVLRAFLVARGESYMAMPGGLTRAAPTDDGILISNQAGAVSKDTWVLASEPEAPNSYWLRSGPAVAAVEPAASMSSRAAENLLWLGRYAERAEGVVRLVRVINDRRNEFEHGANPAGATCLRVLLAALTQITTTYPGFVGDGAADRLESPEAELRSLLLDEHRPGTLAHAGRHLLDCGLAVRDQLSVDSWMVIGSLRHELLDLGTQRSERQNVVQAKLSRVMHSLLALSGLVGEGMVRDPGWRFLDAGRRIERGIQLARLLQATLAERRGLATDSLVLESALIATESIITYRRRYRSQAQLETVLDLLLLDPENPRSLAYQVDALAADVRALPAHVASGRISKAEKNTLATSTALRLVDTAELATPDADGAYVALRSFFAQIADRLADTGDSIHDAHFMTQVPQRAMLTPADPGAARELHRLLG
jgi:uncharacterized circularly permuted ATP-grasp superfamily protein/uncharacterized alpha-E superfamily protein